MKIKKTGVTKCLALALLVTSLLGGCAVYEGGHGGRYDDDLWYYPDYDRIEHRRPTHKHRLDEGHDGTRARRHDRDSPHTDQRERKRDAQHDRTPKKKRDRDSQRTERQERRGDMQRERTNDVKQDHISDEDKRERNRL